MTTSNKILIIAPAWIGDMIMAQTLFKIIKQQTPEIIIHVLAPSWTSPVLARMPEVERIITAPFAHGELALYKRYRMGRELRQEQYIQAIVLPNSFKSALIPYWAKIPRRTGWRGEMRYGLLNDMRLLDKQKLPLMVQRFAALGLAKDESLPKELPWPELQVKALLRQGFAGYPTRRKQGKILALCPGAEFGPAKRWPTAYFAEVANSKLAENWQVWIFGGKNDQPLAADIQRLTNNACVDLTGKTDLQQAIDLLALATVVVSNDTGLMHMAASLNRPLIVIYGSSSPQFTPPLSNQVEILSLNLACSPCFKRECPTKDYKCLLNLPAQMILEAIEKI